MANTQTIRLRQRGTSLEFVLQGPTQVGRHPPEQKSQWAVPERQKPALFETLEAYIQVLGDNTVSRNHCAILPPEKEGGRFSVINLNSKNGTYLLRSTPERHHLMEERINPQPTEHPERILLHQGDIIRVGDTSFIVDRLERPLDYAILVGRGQDHAGALENDLVAIEHELSKRGYKTQVLKWEDATKQNVKDAIRLLSYVTVPDSHVFLYFTGHGGPNGFMLGGQVLNPGELYHPLSALRGKKAVVIDACNAGLFVNEHNRAKIPENVLVLAASGENKEAAETVLLTGANGAGHGYMARFSKALADYLRESPGSFDLRDFYNHIKENGMPNLVLQGPVMCGGSYTVPQNVSVLVSEVVEGREE